MCKGFMFISREKIDDFEWSNNPHVFYVFFKLLFKASYKDKRWEGVDIKRGQLVTGRAALSKELNLSEQVVRTCLDKLTKSGYINQQSTNRYTIITVCNYDSWQTLTKTNNQQLTSEPTNNQPTDNHNINKENKDNKDNIEEEGTKVPKKKVEYPDEYEKDFALYQRKGSKKKGYERWSTLTEEEKESMRRHIPYYMQSNELRFLKDFEGYINQRLFESPVYKGNTILYDPQTFENEQAGVYDPSGWLNYDENFNAWRYFGREPKYDLRDGYTDDNRPDGARVVEQRTVYVWSLATKTWSVTR